MPRTKLPEVLGRIRGARASAEGLRIGNVFHAGDGNLHPLICYDERIAGQSELAERVAGEILMYCVEAGGSITGEHGVGADKKEFMPKMFSAGQPRRDAVGARRARSETLVQSRQSASDAQALRGSARSVSRTSRGARWTRRTVLMQRVSDPSTSNRRRRHRWRRSAPRCASRDSRGARAGPRGCIARSTAHRAARWRLEARVGSRPESRRSRRRNGEAQSTAGPSPRRYDGDRASRYAARGAESPARRASAVPCRSKARSSRATIGGIVATNDSGPLRHRFGTPRDLLIGVTLAMTDGRLVKAGGTVVKNVAGYDLGKTRERLAWDACRDRRRHVQAPADSARLDNARLLPMPTVTRSRTT